MTKRYITSEEHVPEDTSGEIIMQIMDQETKEIFTTRARIARSPQDLPESSPLTITQGPHENTGEQWYIDVLETNVEKRIDRDLLNECLDRCRSEPNVITTRSTDLRAMLKYLVETGQYDSISIAIRNIVHDHLAEHHGELLDEYIDLKATRKRNEIGDALRGSGYRRGNDS